MKLSSVFLLFSLLQVAATGFSQNATVSIQAENIGLEQLFTEIEKQTDVKFLYRYENVAGKSARIDAENAPLLAVLTESLKSHNLNYTLMDNNLIVVAPDVKQQGITITGTVTDNGEPVPGVNVVVKGTATGQITDQNGRFSINVPDERVILQFSYIGYLTSEVLVGNQRVINVDLREDTQQLEEVVVTALGIRREVKALGYAAQEIGGKDLGGARETKLTNYLTGKVAGVQIANTAGGVGGSTVITIRGNKTLAGNNQPLFVVDGVPINNQSNSSSGSGLYSDRDYGDGVFDINPEDVESMTVLKGPNASALYGSRGANGVVIITTKSGKGKKGIGVEYDTNFSWDFINMLPKIQNKYASGYDDDGVANLGKTVINGQEVWIPDYGNLDSWGGPLDGTILIADQFHLPGEPDGIMALWPQPASNIKSFYQPGLTTTNNIAVTGGNETTNARFSAGHSNMTGVIPNHEVKRTNLSLSANTRPSKWITFDGRVSYSRIEGNQRPTIGYDEQNPVWNLAIMARFTPLDFLKKYYEETKSFARLPGENYNPYYIVNELKNHDTRDRFVGYMSGTVHFTEWLRLMGRVGGDIYVEKRQEEWPTGARGTAYNRGRMVQSTRNFRDMNADAILSANREVSENFTLSGSIGASIITQRRETMGWTGQQFKIDGIYNILNFNVVTPDYRLWEKEMQSVYFMAQAAFRNYLFLDITGRNDWSSTLGVNNNSYFYPSVSTSFVFTDAFSINREILSFGKARLSWAQVGNDADPYNTTIGYSMNAVTYDGQTRVSKSSTIPLWNLKNELAESWEVGVDLRFLNSRLGLDVTYYDSKTTNQIMRGNISVASGYENVVINAGEITNKGWEISLNATPVSLSNSLRWDIRWNTSKNNSYVVKLAPGIESYTLISTDLNNIAARVGERFGNIIGYAYKKAPDGQRIVNAGGSYVRESTTSILGNITPDWIGGVNNTLSYKGFSANILLDYVVGGQLSSHTNERMTAKGTGKWTEEGRRPVATDAAGNQMPYVGVLPGVVEVLDGSGNVVGYEPNTKAVPGQVYWANRAWSYIGEEFVMDAGYLMLREVMLGYTFKPAILKKTPLTALSVNLIGRNLWYIIHHMGDIGVSPESQPSTAVGAAGIEALAMPTTRTFGFNIKLSF